MTLPIILQANDGISWWNDPRALEISIESPDIENGIYSAWDAAGQVLEIRTSEAVETRLLLGLKTVSVTSGQLVETGKFRQSQLISVLSSYFEDQFPSSPLVDSDLPACIKLLCSLQGCAHHQKSQAY